MRVQKEEVQNAVVELWTHVIAGLVLLYIDRAIHQTKWIERYWNHKGTQYHRNTWYPVIQVASKLVAVSKAELLLVYRYSATGGESCRECSLYSQT